MRITMRKGRCIAGKVAKMLGGRACHKGGGKGLQ